MNKNEDGNGESSTSTSMEMSQGNFHTADNKSEEKNSSKKIKRGESSSNSSLGEVKVETGAGHSQESIVKETSMNNVLCDELSSPLAEVEAGQNLSQESSIKDASISMDNLPPEMLMEILKYVSTRKLPNCRLVSRQWNEISSRILRNRTNARISFRLSCSEFWWGEYPEDKRMTTFLNCMKTCKNCPYSQFVFTMDDYFSSSKVFNQADFKEFLSDFYSSPNKRIKCLKLRFRKMQEMDEIQMFVPQLGYLLLNRIPRLEHLILNFQSSVEAPEVKLFSTDYQENPEINADQVSVPVPIPVQFQFQLPHLKTLCLESPMISSYTEIVRDLLTSAVNLTRLRVWATKLDDFHFLHSLGKLHLLEGVEIEMDSEFFSSLRNAQHFAPLSFPLPKLEFLHIVMDESEKDGLFLARAETFLGNLLEFSKDTLTELKTHPLGFLPRLQLPIFKNLRKLGVTQYNYFSHQMIFTPGIRSRDIFPRVTELEWSVNDALHAFPQPDSIPLLPSLTGLAVNERKLKGRDIPILTLMCPNLINLLIFTDPADPIEQPDSDFAYPTLNLLKVSRAIWTHMTQLESLEIDVDVDSGEKNSANFDSCFTGISKENCRSLCKMKRAEEEQSQPGGGSTHKTDEYDRLAVREYPSILNMKDLKKLTISPYVMLFTKLLDEEEFSPWKWTWVSQEYAFNLMPHLQVRVNHY